MKRQRGQIGLIVILIMTVLLTVGASLASQSISDVAISRQGEQGQKTLQGAEAGVEQALSKLSTYQNANNSDSLQISGAGGTVNADIQVNKLKTIETRVDQGGTVPVDFTGVNPSGKDLTITWGQSGTCGTATPIASLLITIVNSANAARHVAVAGCDLSASNGFPWVGSNPDPRGFVQKTFTMQTGDVFMMIQALGNDAAILVSSSNPTDWLPYQSYAIRSTATAATQGNETSAVQVNRNPGMPSIFNYVLYSGSTLTK